MAAAATGAAAAPPTMAQGIAPDGIELLECIGRGSYGDVYRAVEAGTGRQLAVKVVDLEDM